MPRLLVVDDDPVVGQFLQTIATDNGCICQTAENGSQALDALQTLVFDVAIVDLFMPVKEGIATIIEMRKRAPTMKILAISGGGRHIPAGSMLDHALGLGAHAALVKPFSADVFLCVVEKLLGRAVARPTPT